MTHRICLVITCLQITLLKDTEHQLTTAVQDQTSLKKGELRVSLEVHADRESDAQISVTICEARSHFQDDARFESPAPVPVESLSSS